MASSPRREADARRAPRRVQGERPEKEILHEYAEKRRTLDDIDMQELSTDDRRTLFQHAVLMTFADGISPPRR